jgi:hypothetical protein
MKRRNASLIAQNEESCGRNSLSGHAARHNLTDPLNGERAAEEYAKCVRSV